MRCGPLTSVRCRLVCELGFTVPGVEAFYREMSAMGRLFSVPPKKQDFGVVLAHFVDSEGEHCSLAGRQRSTQPLCFPPTRTLIHDPADNSLPNGRETLSVGFSGRSANSRMKKGTRFSPAAALSTECT
jgi:hypothetical protein